MVVVGDGVQENALYHLVYPGQVAQLVPHCRRGCSASEQRLSPGHERVGSLPPAAETLIAGARIAILTRSAGIARIDAGPAAIALTPRDKDAAPPKSRGLVAKEERWLLKEQTDDDERTARIAALLEDLIAEKDRA